MPANQRRLRFPHGVCACALPVAELKDGFECMCVYLNFQKITILRQYDTIRVDYLLCLFLVCLFLFHLRIRIAPAANKIRRRNVRADDWVQPSSHAYFHIAAHIRLLFSLLLILKVVYRNHSMSLFHADFITPWHIHSFHIFT